MIDRITDWVKQQVEGAGAKGCVFGLSGGLDSSVVGALCKKAFPESSLGLLLPCFSRGEDLKHARKVAEAFFIKTKLIDLGPAFDQFYIQLEGKVYDKKDMNLAIANLKPRLRMISLYYQANKFNYLVVGTGNRSEAAMGYCTKYGDAGVDLLPLAHLLKSQVRELARELNVPAGIIKKPPSAGLWSGQTDEDEMGITYNDLDKIIIGLENNELKGLDPRLVEKVKKTMAASRHKRCVPPAFKP
ncbi:MAG: NAD(+) synthase [Candidatus Margulisiibacteriota bacterium]|nr:NAD(+) synthase [Candidatus Margulisiibacteriota bacterium]